MRAPAVPKLKRWMKVNGVTQAALADAVGVQQSSVSLWLGSRARPESPKRAVLEELTAIPERDWEFPSERRAREKAVQRIRAGEKAA